MKSYCVLLFLPILMSLFGCCSTPDSTFLDRPRFFEQEITSRRWVDMDGLEVHYLRSSTSNFPGHGEIMIAEFGNKDSKQARCLEIYKVQRKAAPNLHDTFILLDHDWGPREQAWWGSVVVSVQAVMISDRIAFGIVREPTGDNPKGSQLHYSLDLSRNQRVTVNISERWVETK